MLKNKDFLEYIKKILSKESNQEKVISLVEDFRDYLELTNMADNDTLGCIDKIIKAIPLYYKLGSIFDYDDMSRLLDFNDSQPIKKKKKTYEDRHYDSYGSYNDVFNYSCNSGRSSSFNGYCSSSHYTYSSSCGGSGSYRSGC